jgi:hypothetical protein
MTAGERRAHAGRPRRGLGDDDPMRLSLGHADGAETPTDGAVGQLRVYRATQDPDDVRRRHVGLHVAVGGAPPRHVLPLRARRRVDGGAVDADRGAVEIPGERLGEGSAQAERDAVGPFPLRLAVHGRERLGAGRAQADGRQRPGRVVHRDPAAGPGRHVGLRLPTAAAGEEPQRWARHQRQDQRHGDALHASPVAAGDAVGEPVVVAALRDPACLPGERLPDAVVDLAHWRTVRAARHERSAHGAE